MDLKSLRLLLKALGEDTRLRVLYLLSVRSLTVGEMARILRVAQPSLSKHLARLRELGLVTDRRQGMHVFYHAVRSRPAGALVSDLVRMIRPTAVCRGDLSRLKRVRSGA